LERRGIEVLCLPAVNGRVALSALLVELGSRGVKSVLIEGGGQVAATALLEGVVDKVLFFYAPLLLGGDGRPMIGPLARERVADGVKLHTREVIRIGDDTVVSAYVEGKGKNHAHRNNSN
jgi:diaminohydroxyphosphoribosylaminopyrimidine deaminase/5-amino-6-(5-phosphoribosylamino)uracil reductase